MGQQVRVRPVRSLESALVALAGQGIRCQVAMVDGGLVAPSAPLPAGWREARLRTPAGMITVERREEDLVLIVFGNADAATLAVRERLEGALATPAR